MSERPSALLLARSDRTAVHNPAVTSCGLTVVLQVPFKGGLSRHPKATRPHEARRAETVQRAGT